MGVIIQRVLQDLSGKEGLGGEVVLFLWYFSSKDVLSIRIASLRKKYKEKFSLVEEKSTARE
jgi:hypothetical protein